MRSLRYLNTLLTLLTILLAMQLWTAWSIPAGPSQRGADGQSAGGEALPTLATPVLAQAGGGGSGIPDAGAQRREMIDLLKKQTQQTEEIISLLKSGQVRVRVEAASGK